MEEIEKGASFVLKENNRVMEMDTNEERNLKKNIQQLLGNFQRSPETFSRENTEARLADLIGRSLQKKADEGGLAVIIGVNENGMLTVKHKHYGSRPNFAVSTNLSGLFGEKPGLLSFPVEDRMYLVISKAILL